MSVLPFPAEYKNDEQYLHEIGQLNAQAARHQRNNSDGFDHQAVLLNRQRPIKCTSKMDAYQRSFDWQDQLIRVSRKLGIKVYPHPWSQRYSLDADDSRRS